MTNWDYEGTTDGHGLLLLLQLSGRHAGRISWRKCSAQHHHRDGNVEQPEAGKQNLQPAPDVVQNGKHVQVTAIRRVKVDILVGEISRLGHRGVSVHVLPPRNIFALASPFDRVH
jgi:hypothetical protein